MNHPTYQDALTIIQRLKSAGHEAYFIGGTVRDILRNVEPHDIDIVTSAPPEETQRLFPKHSPVGAMFGVVSIITPSGIVEVATYRTEENYTDRRRPKNVAWSTLKDDVVRRDFTINGLALDPLTNEILDYVHGQQDLELGLIRTIGNPTERFGEDPVRLLRAVRLKNQLGFQYDQETYMAIRDCAKELAHVASERIQAELNRMFVQPNRAAAIRDLDELQLLAVILPEVTALHGVPQPQHFHREGDVFAHALKAVEALPTDAPVFLVWATLLHDVAKPVVLSFAPRQGRIEIRTPDHAQRSADMATVIAKRLMFSKADREAIAWLIEHHMSLKDIESMRPAKQERYLLDPRFPWLLELHRADALGTTPSDLGLYDHDLKLYSDMKQRHADLDPLSKPLVTGDDLILANLLSPSPLVQLILDEVRDAQLRNEITTKDDAILLAQRLISDHRKPGSR